MDNISVFFSRCKICSLPVLFTNDSLNSHLKVQHKISLREYRQQHFTQKRAQYLRRSLPDMNEDQDEIGSDGLASDELVEDLDDEEEKMFSDDFKAVCRTECNICKEPVTFLPGHVKMSHYMSIQEFRKLHPQVVFALKTFHW